MENKRWKALHNYLKADAKIFALCGDRIGFVRIPKDHVQEGESYIVFNEGEHQRDNYANESFVSGINMIPVLIDIVVPYEKIAEGRDLRGYIRSLIGRFNGTLTPDWSGEIVFTSFSEITHDVDSNNILLGSLYLFKEGYDYSNTESGE